MVLYEIILTDWIVLQSIFRAYRAKKVFQLARACSISVQTLIRRHQAVTRFSQIRNRSAAVRSLQCAWRCFIARRRRCSLMDGMKRANAASTLAKVIRGHLARTRAQYIFAATLIQGACRVFLAKSRVARHRRIIYLNLLGVCQGHEAYAPFPSKQAAQLSLGFRLMLANTREAIARAKSGARLLIS